MSKPNQKKVSSTIHVLTSEKSELKFNSLKEWNEYAEAFYKEFPNTPKGVKVFRVDVYQLNNNEDE